VGVFPPFSKKKGKDRVKVLQGGQRGVDAPSIKRKLKEKKKRVL